MIQMNRLEGFYWVARTGGYSKAARAFPYPITQPAVHQQVKKLETEVGVPLFERVGKDTIQLTPAGEQLYQFVAPFYGGLEGLVRSLRAGEYGGELRIYSAGMILRRLMPPWIRRLQRRHPGVRITLRELHAPTADLLLSGKADLLVAARPEMDESFDSRQIATLYPFLVLPAGHRLANKARVSLKDLAGDTFVGYTADTVQNELQMQELARHGVRPTRIITVDSMDTILGYVDAGLGFSLVPDLNPEGPKLKGVVAKLLSGKRHHYAVQAVWRKSSAQNPLLQAALETAPEA